MKCDKCDGTGEKRMEIKLFGLPTCSRCKSAKMMLEKRKKEGIIEDYTYEDVNPLLAPPLLKLHLPLLYIDGKKYDSKEALWRIRDIK